MPVAIMDLTVLVATVQKDGTGNIFFNQVTLKIFYYKNKIKYFNT
jgi:hypothetical protein